MRNKEKGNKGKEKVLFLLRTTNYYSLSFDRYQIIVDFFGVSEWAGEGGGISVVLASYRSRAGSQTGRQTDRYIIFTVTVVLGMIPAKQPHFSSRSRSCSSISDLICSAEPQMNPNDS